MNRNPWDQYWQNASISGCFAGGDNPIDAGLQSYWRDNICKNTRCARILDVGCGDGFVARQFGAQTYAFTYLGIDNADVSLALDDKRCHIRSNLSFDAFLADYEGEKFDCIVSNFGIEYALTHLNPKALKRCLLPGAVQKYIVHHRDSPISSRTHKEIEVLSYLTSIEFWHNALHVGLLNVMRASAPDPKWLDAVNSALVEAYAIVGNEEIVNALFEGVFGLIMQVTEQGLNDPRVLGEKCVQLEALASAQLQVLSLQEAAAKSELQIQHWITSWLHDAKFFGHYTPVTVSGIPVAWEVTFL